MTVSNGRDFLAIPGPTTVPDAVLNAMHRPAQDIYAGEMIDLTLSTLADLKTVFQTTGDTYIYAANGHGAWEAALTNTLSRGDTVLVLDSGRFARGWGEMAAPLGLTVEVLEGSLRAPVDPARVAERLRSPDAAEIKAVLVVQIDTASGVVNDIPAIRAAMDEAESDALLCVDTIASLGCMEYRMDAWGVDVTVAGSQKGLMTPPGLSFCAAGPKAKAARAQADLVTRYWDWGFRDGGEHYQKYCGTMPEHLMFGLRQGLDMVRAEGLENVWQRHTILADATRAAVSRWSEGGALSFNIHDVKARANSITMVRVDDATDPAQLLDYAREKCGVVLGVAIGELAGQGFRIAHMGHVNAPMMLGTLGVIETALRACDIPHGTGALDAAVEVIANAVPAEKNETRIAAE
ncbi:MAG: alanine--glyoxylate aminotransferase family protein [Pseudomonadota bacterium]